MMGDDAEAMVSALASPTTFFTGDRVLTPSFVRTELDRLDVHDAHDAATFLDCTATYVREHCVPVAADDELCSSNDGGGGPDDKEMLQLLVDGYLRGCTKPATLAQCAAAAIPSPCNSDGLKDIVLQATRKLGGTYRDQTYFPPTFLASQDEKVKDTLVATGYLPSSSSSSPLDLANPTIQQDLEASSGEALAFIPSAAAGGRLFACAYRVVDGLVAALLQLPDPVQPLGGGGDGEGCWWLHAPALLPTSLADHPGDMAALLSHGVCKAGCACTALGGQFAVKTGAVAALRVFIVGTLLSSSTTPTPPSKSNAVKAMLQHLGRRAEDHDVLATLLGLLWDDHLQFVVQTAATAAAERVKQRRTILTLGLSQAEKPQHEAERDDIFAHHWSLLHVALKATEYVGKDGGDDVAALLSHLHDGAVSRCALLAALVTVFACWENNVAPPQSLTARFAVRRAGGVLAFDFDAPCASFMEVSSRAPLLPAAIDLFGREERKLVLNELPKSTAVAIVKLWESVETSESQRTPASFLHYMNTEGKNSFRVITARPDKKVEKAIVGHLKAELLASLHLVIAGESAVAPPPSKGASLVVAFGGMAIASAEVRRQLTGQLLALVYIEVTGGTRGAVWPAASTKVTHDILRQLSDWLRTRCDSDIQLATTLSKLMPADPLTLK